MSDLDYQLMQCGKPTSAEGKKLAKTMNEHHYPLTRWGNEECMATERMTIYSPEQLEQLLKNAGFTKILIDLVEKENWLRCIASAR